MTDTETIEQVEQAEQTEEAKKRAYRTVVPVVNVYEEWVAHPGLHEIVAYEEHGAFASKPGWFFSGRRGVGPEMQQPLPADIAHELELRDVSRK